MHKPQLKQLPIECLSRGKFQPRKQFDIEALTELSESIKSSGLIQPIVVRPISDKQYEIVAGERRWRAAQKAGLTEVSCLINAYSDEQTAAVSTIENVNRVDLNPIEEAYAYQRLIDDFGYLHDEIAAVVGKSRSKITNLLRLLVLDKRVQTFLIEGEITEGHGKILAGCSESIQYQLAEKCIRQGWSVRKLEQMAKLHTQPKTAMQNAEDVNIKALESLASEQVGAAVKLEHDEVERSGWLKIKYYNADTLAGILDKLGIQYEE
ncbi:MAG: chromosome partitioning protein ParB [Legionellales bacterium]|nr:chromosome partitioning protein ParB [Legionellales bacterium]|tara:strand:- start:62 stop:856 length:795 start_codon:yes stop_codon:yes gene_type:complete